MAKSTGVETPPIRNENVPLTSPAPRPAPRPTTNMKYTAVWEKNTAGEIQMYDVTYEEYRANYDRLWGQGWRLKALQPTVVGGKVRYTAVWTPSTAGEIQVYGWTYEDYRKKYDELWKQGWRLKLIQPYVLPGDQVRYDAVWQQSTAGETQVYGWTYEDYRKKYDELWKQGWRLKLIQPFVLSGDQVRYTAVWQQSTAGEIQVYGWTYEDYRKKYDELWKQGWRLKLIQPFVLSGDQVRYTAVWQQSTAGEIQVYGWGYQDYRAKYDELWSQGWRLKMLQTFFTRPAPPKIRVPKPSTQQMVDKALAAYRAAGGLASKIGIPVEPVRVTGGQATWRMSGGQLVGQEDGPWKVEVKKMVKVYFVGFKCFEESSELSGSDEPYFIVSYGAGAKSATQKFVASDIDKGETKIYDKAFAEDIPLGPGYLHYAIYEHDEGSTTEARNKVAKMMQDVVAAGAQAAAIYDASQAAQGGAAGNASNYAAIAGAVVGGPMGALLGKGIVGALGLGDDYVWDEGRTLFNENTNDIPMEGEINGVKYNRKYWANPDGGGDYEVFFRVVTYDKPEIEWVNPV